jgi:hypothetical protein
MAEQEMTPSQHGRASAISAAITKYKDLGVEFHRATTREAQAKALLDEASAIKKNVNEQYAKLLIMAELFEFDLKEEYRNHTEKQGRLRIQPEPPSGITDLSESPAQMPKSIKDYLIAAAHRAYPNPIRASLMRQEIESIGISIHENTVGMTLHRLLRDGVLRRDGRDWFFVPANSPQVAASREEESPGDEPGLPLDAAG